MSDKLGSRPVNSEVPRGVGESSLGEDPLPISLAQREAWPLRSQPNVSGSGGVNPQVKSETPVGGLLWFQMVTEQESYQPRHTRL